jgi:hypothetical protein
MPTKKQTFEDREKAAGLFGTTSGYSNQSDNRGTYSQMNSAQANYKNTLENALGGRLTQSQIEKAQRHAGSMGLDFDPNAGYVPKGYGKTPRASSSQRRDSREARSAATGNTISKGGAAGLAGALGQYGTLAEKALMAKMMFNSGALTDAEKNQLGLTEIRPQGYDNVPDMSALGGNWKQRQEAMGVRVMTPSELRRREAEVLAGVERQNNAAIGAVHPQLMGYQPINTSSLQGLSMIERGRLSSQGLLGSYMSNNQPRSQAGLPLGGLIGTSALGQATGGYFG